MFTNIDALPNGSLLQPSYGKGGRKVRGMVAKARKKGPPGRLKGVASGK